MIRAGALLVVLSIAACATVPPRLAATPELPQCQAASRLAAPPPAAHSRAYGVAGAQEGGALMVWTLDAKFTINSELGLELQFADGSMCLAALAPDMEHGLRIALAGRDIRGVELGVCDEVRGACIPTRMEFKP